MTNIRILSAHLFRLRKEARLTINQVGAMLGVSGKTISAWENGRGEPSADRLVALRDLYKLSSVAAFYGEGDNALNAQEREVIRKYRILSERGKEYVKITLDLAAAHYSTISVPDQ